MKHIRAKSTVVHSIVIFVATVLTVYGIETTNICPGTNLYNLVATVLTVYGIETVVESLPVEMIVLVATVLTVYGIETSVLLPFDQDR